MPCTLSNGHILIADLRLSSTHGIFDGTITEADDAELLAPMIKEGSVIYDIGAHVGLYSVFFSNLIGRTGNLYSFELNPELRGSLSRTIDLMQNATLFTFGLASRNEKTRLFVPEDPSGASLKNWSGGSLGQVHEVDCELRRLDDIIAEKGLELPDFIKVDVEGAEEEVFRGATATLDRENAPVVFFEVSAKAAAGFNSTESGALDFLASLQNAKYSFFDGRGKGHPVLQIGKEIPPPVPGALATNLFAVPASRVESFLGSSYLNR